MLWVFKHHYHHHYPHFTYEETEVQGNQAVYPKVTQLMSRSARPPTHMFWCYACGFTMAFPPLLCLPVPIAVALLLSLSRELRLLFCCPLCPQKGYAHFTAFLPVLSAPLQCSLSHLRPRPTGLSRPAVLCTLRE